MVFYLVIFCIILMEKITIVDAPHPKVMLGFERFPPFVRDDGESRFVISSEARNLFASLP
jgi:hypothetical protein